ncbi:hypothetical protein P3T76_015231 [Phytophthora citrophthora]|uniref:Uncharacterized protein n=1 Tax=Phytophthora citrophthora TaxID=4793 RepID=A0AAD9FZN1_9STRA|nr:hypothetical protein P3T76_015231 [Phytophthora citrophthora]
MCSEYIAIICSTSIFYFLQHHPRFGWHEQDGEGLAEWEETLVTGSWQIGIEMVVDFNVLCGGVVQWYSVAGFRESGSIPRCGFYDVCVSGGLNFYNSLCSRNWFN